MIAVVDYGMGNIRSVSKAVEAVGGDVEVTSNPQTVAKAEAVILPGVGAFARGIENLAKFNLVRAIHDIAQNGTPIFGICLGLQLLFTESEEHGIYKGLDLIKGRVKKFPRGLKVPHMGWNQVKVNPFFGKEKFPEGSEESAGPLTQSKMVNSEHLRVSGTDWKLFDDIPDNSYFYFVHSYFVEPEDRDTILATTEYGIRFASAVGKEKIYGVQFHPEKSGDLGLKILDNFLKTSHANC